VIGGSITGGSMDLRGNLETTAFRRVDLKTVTIT
jgi:hypothetical protein